MMKLFNPSLGLIALSLLDPVRAVLPTVDLTYSKYISTPLPNGVSQWLGIRYAAPPLGDLRFKAPRDPLHSDVVQLANQVRSRKGIF